MKKAKTPKVTFPAGSFVVTSFGIDPGTVNIEQRFRIKMPAGSQVLSALATVDKKITVFYKYDVPHGVMIDFDILLLKEGEVLKPASSYHKYIHLQSVAVDTEVYHLFHHYKMSPIITSLGKPN